MINFKALFFYPDVIVAAIAAAVSVFGTVSADRPWSFLLLAIAIGTVGYVIYECRAIAALPDIETEEERE